MKKSLFVHGTWLLVAVVSFGVGWQWGPRVSSSSTQAGAIQGPPPSLIGASSMKKDPNQAALNTADEALRLGSRLSEADIQSLGETFRKAASPIERRLAFGKILENLTVENALLMRAQIEHLDPKQTEFREFHYAWGAIAGADAALFGATTKEDDMTHSLAGWANADPAAAKDWFESLTIEGNPDFEYLLKDRKVDPNGLRNHLMRGMVHGLAENDPKIASDFVLSMAESGHKEAFGMMHIVAENMMRTDKPSKAASWAESLPEGRARQAAMSRVADRFVDENPEAAAEWASAYAEAPEGRAVIGEVGANWSHRDPEAAIDWLSSLPNSHGQNNGMHRALHDWTHRDPTAASEFLTAMPESPAKNAAITGFSSRIAHEDPQAGIAWAETITSEGQRNQTMVAIGRAWSRKDATAAADWVAASGLPEKLQQAILNPPKDQRRR